MGVGCWDVVNASGTACRLDLQLRGRRIERNHLPVAPVRLTARSQQRRPLDGGPCAPHDLCANICTQGQSKIPHKCGLVAEG